MQDPSPPTTAYILSTHPLVLEELGRSLAGTCQVRGVHIRYSLTPNPGPLAAGAGSVCVVDACFPMAATQSLVSAIRASCPETRIVAVVEEVSAANAFPLLRVGVKGLLTFAESRVQLGDAVTTVAGGGYWVPRALLSAFLDGLMEQARPARLPGAPLSPREAEVLEPLLRSLSNKEIAEGLNISERTVKFHVSNLLGKFAVQRRSDLIRQSRFWERAS